MDVVDLFRPDLPRHGAALAAVAPRRAVRGAVLELTFSSLSMPVSGPGSPRTLVPVCGRPAQIGRRPCCRCATHALRRAFLSVSVSLCVSLCLSVSLCVSASLWWTRSPPLGSPVSGPCAPRQRGAWETGRPAAVSVSVYLCVSVSLVLCSWLCVNVSVLLCLCVLVSLCVSVSLCPCNAVCLCLFSRLFLLEVIFPPLVSPSAHLISSHLISSHLMGAPGPPRRELPRYPGQATLSCVHQS